MIGELKGFQKREIDHKERYLSRLEHKLETTKVYPKWAVVIFVVTIVVSMISLCFTYRVQSDSEKSKKQAYQQGISDYERYLNGFFKENPKIFSLYEKWKEK